MLFCLFVHAHVSHFRKRTRTRRGSAGTWQVGFEKRDTRREQRSLLVTRFVVRALHDLRGVMLASTPRAPARGFALASTPRAPARGFALEKSGG